MSKLKIAKKSKVNEAGNYTKPAMRKRIFNRIKAGGKGGSRGQWSARKAQMLASAYKKSRGRLHIMSLAKSQQSLKKWTKQKWRTKSGKNSTQGANATGNATYLREQSKPCHLLSMPPRQQPSVKLDALASSLVVSL